MTDVTTEEISEFLSADKFLDGLLPEWGDGYSGVLQARWGLLNGVGIGISSHICISLKPSLDRPSITLIYRQHPVYRLDIVPMDEEKPNPPWASKHGLPNYVAGPHTHPWDANMEYVNLNWDKSLPCRKPLPHNINELEHALAQAVSDLNITITSEQRVVNLPKQGRFFS